jgi:GntR family transcriptional regulator
MFDEERFVPQYHRVERYLRDRIWSGLLRPGDPIPPESHLVRQFKVSRTTVRQAVGRLVYEGLIERHRGRGSFVAEPRLEHTKMFLSFEEEMRARGARPAIKLLDMQTVPAEGRVAQQLGLQEATPVFMLERQRIVDGQVIGYEIRYLLQHIGEALTPDEIRNEPLVPALRRILGKPRTRLGLIVSASAAGRRDARILETKLGAPVLIRENTWYVDPEGPVQYGKTTFRGDRYQMALEIAASTGVTSDPLGPDLARAEAPAVIGLE